MSSIICRPILFNGSELWEEEEEEEDITCWERRWE